jgi:hypothetical protein
MAGTTRAGGGGVVDVWRTQHVQCSETDEVTSEHTRSLSSYTMSRMRVLNVWQRSCCGASLTANCSVGEVLFKPPHAAAFKRASSSCYSSIDAAMHVVEAANMCRW